MTALFHGVLCDTLCESSIEHLHELSSAPWWWHEKSVETSRNSDYCVKCNTHSSAYSWFISIFVRLTLYTVHKILKSQTLNRQKGLTRIRISSISCWTLTILAFEHWLLFCKNVQPAHYSYRQIWSTTQQISFLKVAWRRAETRRSLFIYMGI